MLEKLDVTFGEYEEPRLVNGKELQVAYMDEFQVMDALLLSADKILKEGWDLGAVELLLNARECIKSLRELVVLGIHE